MASRKDLHNRLVEILGSKNVYFNPPESIRMNYPCIVYERDDIEPKYADNITYGLFYRYQLTVIDRDPDSEYVEKVALLPQCRFVRHFVSDNLSHDIFTIYFK